LFLTAKGDTLILLPLADAIRLAFQPIFSYCLAGITPLPLAPLKLLASFHYLYIADYAIVDASRHDTFTAGRRLPRQLLAIFR